MGRDVAAQAGIGVVPPGPAEIIGPVHDEEVVQAGLLQCGGHADPAEPGPDHHHAMRRLCWHGRRINAGRSRVTASREGRSLRPGAGWPCPHRVSGWHLPAPVDPKAYDRRASGGRKEHQRQWYALAKSG